MVIVKSEHRNRALLLIDALMTWIAYCQKANTITALLLFIKPSGVAWTFVSGYLAYVSKIDTDVSCF